MLNKTSFLAFYVVLFDGNHPESFTDLELINRLLFKNKRDVKMYHSLESSKIFTKGSGAPQNPTLKKRFIIKKKIKNLSTRLGN